MTADLAERADQLERTFHNEWSRATNINVRGTAFVVVSAVAVLLLAQFSAIWLDDNRWSLPDLWDKGMQLGLGATVLAFLLCTLCATVVIWPRGGFGDGLGKHLDHLRTGADEQAAIELANMIARLQGINNGKVKWVRRASGLLVVAVIGTVAQGSAFAFMAEPVDAIPVAPQASTNADGNALPAPDVQERLARAFGPRVWLHPKELYFPLDPEAFIRSSELRWRLRRSSFNVEARGEVVAARLGSGCDSSPGTCYAYRGYLARQLTRPFTVNLWRPGELNRRRGFFLEVADSARAGDVGSDPGAPVFYEFRQTPDELLLTYWFFYGFSRPHVVDDLPGGNLLLDQLSHEGDWENIDVTLSPEDHSPIAVYFYGHGKPKRVPWKDICTVGADPEACELGGLGHPIVYSALDSHASYAEAGVTKVCSDLGCARDIAAPGFRWDTWEKEDFVRSARDQAWFGFGGAWGAAGPVGDRTGPLGPSPWKLPADPDPGDLAAAPE